MLKLGRLAPHPESTHPRVKLSSHLSGPLPVPAVVDWATKVAAWPMYLNDAIGDCTCAGVGHMLQAWTAYAGAEVALPGADILKLYEVLSGYNPKTGANDNGCVEQDVLQYLVRHGVDRHKIRAFAQVDHTSPAEMKAALQFFGSVYTGINCPESMQQQFAAGQVIDYVPGSPVEGGHCVVIQKWDADYIYIVTWGKLVKMTWAFWQQYGEEAWVIVTDDWLAKGTSPSGLNITGLLAEFAQVTGTETPGPQHATPARQGLLTRIRVRWNRLRKAPHD